LVSVSSRRAIMDHIQVFKKSLIAALLLYSVSSLAAYDFGLVYTRASTLAGSNRMEIGVFSGFSFTGITIEGSLSIGESPYAEYNGDTGDIIFGNDYYLDPDICTTMRIFQNDQINTYILLLLGGEYALTGINTNHPIPKFSQRPVFADVGLGGIWNVNDAIYLGLQVSTSIVSYINDGSFLFPWDYSYIRFATKFGMRLNKK
jgi:hypothetical protein